jgi:hypothetical protein
MSPDQINLVLELLHQQARALEKIACALSSATPTTAPNYQRSLQSFKNFDWASIDARVDGFDAQGPTVVSWGGQLYTRRSPVNKFDPAIWFSRCVGKGEDGANQYERLITFKSVGEVEPISPKVNRLMEVDF